MKWREKTGGRGEEGCGLVIIEKNGKI